MDKGQIHLVGVAGAGMSPLAQALLAAGWDATGSDRYLDSGHEVAVIPKLRRAGVRFLPQDGSGITPGTHAVVVSTAIEDDNPDLAAARRHSVPVLHRSEMLATLLEGAECIAVTGTSGKTTVTGLVGYLLEQLGDDPTVVNGGIVANWETDERIGNFRAGRSRRWVIEADESDRSLMHYSPDWAIITNISSDHFPEAEARTLFGNFARRVRKGLVEPPGDDEPWLSFQPELSAAGLRFTHGGQEFRVPLLGRHNAENSLHAILLCEQLGHRLDRIAEALITFRGIRRRLDVAGTAGDVTVIDDYAHNPAKIRAAWQAVAPHCRRVIAVWRPHGFKPLREMFDAFNALFREMGEGGVELFILPVYYAGGTTEASVTSDMLVAELTAAGVPIELAADYDDLIRRIVSCARPGDLVLSMGARDPELPALARRLVEAISHEPGKATP